LKLRGHYDEEIFEDGKDYLVYIDLFQNTHDVKGNLINLPYEGTILKQPNSLIQIFKIIQG